MEQRQLAGGAVGDDDLLAVARGVGQGASQAAPPTEPVLETIGVLREMNEKGKRKVPDGAPTDFVKPRWECYVFSEDGIDKPLYEMRAITSSITPSVWETCGFPAAAATCFPASGGRTSGTTVVLR